MYSLRSLLLHIGDKEAAGGTQIDNAHYSSHVQDTAHRTFLTKDIDKFSGAVVIGLILIMFIIGTYMNQNSDSYGAYAHTSVDGVETTNDKKPNQYQEHIIVPLNQAIAQKNWQYSIALASVARVQERAPEQSPLHSIQEHTILHPSELPIQIALSDTSNTQVKSSVKAEVERIEAENEPVAIQTVVDPSPPVAMIEDNKQYVVKERMVVPMTAYSSTVDQTDSTPFITASNKRVRWGIVAANFLPFGTKVRIPSMYGDTVFVVEDRMNKRYWHRVDIWMHTRQEALQFGIRNLELEILQEA